MLKYQILFNTIINNELTTCLCNAKDLKGRYWCFTYTEEQAKDRVASLKEIGIDAWYNEINNGHWGQRWVDRIKERVLKSALLFCAF